MHTRIYRRHRGLELICFRPLLYWKNLRDTKGLMVMMEVQENKNVCDYVNVLEVAEDEVEECVCGTCGVSYFRIKGKRAKTICKKCFYANRKKKNEKMQYTVENGIATFITSNGIEFIVDEEDAERVADYSWYINNYGYVRGWVNGKDVTLHRFILGLLDSEGKALVVDHINHDKLNNTKGNLRVCTNQQNLRNTNAKGYIKGRNGKHQVKIMVDGRSISLGEYESEEHARAVRIMAEKEYFGEFSSKVDLFEDAEIIRLYEEAIETVRLRHQNKARVEDDVVYVTVISKGMTKEFVVNTIDYDMIKSYKWCVGDKGKIVGNVNGEQQQLARFLLGLEKGDRSKRVTFIDGNNLNFRRENLKVVECKTKKKESKEGNVL